MHVESREMKQKKHSSLFLPKTANHVSQGCDLAITK